ncbi:hypothetical protein Tco_0153345 [Tanacetum coccineum]
MSTLNQQTLIDLGANDRPLMLDKGNYIPWESRFRRFLDNKLEDGERMWCSIKKGPYERPLITDPDDSQVKILEPLSKMTEANTKQCIADVKVINYLLQAIPNDIHNSVDACKNAKEIKGRRILSQSYYVTHPSSFVDYEEDYQGELQGDSQEDKLTTAMINQAVIQNGRVDIQTKNAGFGGNDNRNAGRQNKNQTFNAGSGSTQNNDSNQIVQRVPRTEIDVTLLEDRKRRWMSDSQNSLREFYKNDVILMSVSLSKTLKELKQELMEEMRHSMRMLAKDTRSQDGIDDKDNDKGSKSRSQSMKEQAYNKEQRERPRPHELNDKSNLIDLMKECHQ